MAVPPIHQYYAMMDALIVRVAEIKHYLVSTSQERDILVGVRDLCTTEI